MDKQAQWDIETLQKTIGVIPYEEMERDAIERAIKALEKQVPQKVKKYKGLNETACAGMMYIPKKERSSKMMITVD